MLALILSTLGFTSKKTTLPGYQLESKIGEGAMGVLYKAKQLGLDRDVAVKLCKSDKQFSQFSIEAKAAAELSHPNTVRVFDSGVSGDGVPFYVMELLDGADLEKVVERDGSLTESEVIEILAQLADALVDVHRRGFVHQDIKPANVVLTNDGVAKLVDFGLVRESGRDNTDGKFYGTPAYSSPEQIGDPESVGAHSDIYALGALAFYLLTGREVFGGDSVAEVCCRHLYEVAPRTSECSEQPVSDALDALIAECLSKNATDRPTAQSVRDRLAAVGC